MSRKIMLLVFLCFSLFSLPTIRAQQTLFINEFLASNSNCCTDEYGESDDWVELYNAGTESVNIGGLYITDDLTDPTQWYIPNSAPDSTTIPPGGFLILWCDKQMGQGVLHVDIKLSVNGEQIGLFANNGVTLIDTLTYGVQQTDISYGRSTDGGTNWRLFQNPTPGQSNFQDSVSFNLVINEFLAINNSCCVDEFGEFNDWIELYNTGNETIDIGGMYITDSLANPTQWQIPKTAPNLTTMSPSEFLVLWCDKDVNQGVLHVDVRLSGDGEQIGLFAEDGMTPVDTLSFENQQPDISSGRFPDGDLGWLFFIDPTPGTANTPVVVTGDLFINEFLAINDSCYADEYGEFDDWLEIYNGSTEPLDIGGMFITDDLSDPLQWQIPYGKPDSTTIQPEGFLVLWCDNDSDQGVLHTEIRLSSSGEQIGLFAADGKTPIDTHTFGAQSSNVSNGRLPDGSDNWQSFSNPTPGKSNSSVDIVDKSFKKQLFPTYLMNQNYPNPFNPVTYISYQLPVASYVVIKIYDLLGKEIITLVNEYKIAGFYTVKWNGLNSDGFPVASGIYLYQFMVDDFNQIRKMLLLR